MVSHWWNDQNPTPCSKASWRLICPESISSPNARVFLQIASSFRLKHLPNEGNIIQVAQCKHLGTLHLDRVHRHMCVRYWQCLWWCYSCYNLADSDLHISLHRSLLLLWTCLQMQTSLKISWMQALSVRCLCTSYWKLPASHISWKCAREWRCTLDTWRHVISYHTRIWCCC